jgi:hypothetical protein
VAFDVAADWDVAVDVAGPAPQAASDTALAMATAPARKRRRLWWLAEAVDCGTGTRTMVSIIFSPTNAVLVLAGWRLSTGNICRSVWSARDILSFAAEDVKVLLLADARRAARNIHDLEGAPARRGFRNLLKKRRPPAASGAATARPTPTSVEGVKVEIGPPRNRADKAPAQLLDR